MKYLKNISEYAFVIIVIFILIIIGYRYIKTKLQEHKQEQIQKQERKILALEREKIENDLIGKYKATSFFEISENEDDYDYENAKYSSDKEKLLISKNPILFSGHVIDIFNENGEYIMKFEPHTLEANEVIEAKLSEELFKKITNDTSNKTFAIVINVENVIKKESKEESEIFLIKGICLDVGFIKSPTRRS